MGGWVGTPSFLAAFHKWTPKMGSLLLCPRYSFLCRTLRNWRRSRNESGPHTVMAPNWIDLSKVLSKWTRRGCRKDEKRRGGFHTGKREGNMRTCEVRRKKWRVCCCIGTRNTVKRNKQERAICCIGTRDHMMINLRDVKYIKSWVAICQARPQQHNREGWLLLLFFCLGRSRSMNPSLSWPTFSFLLVLAQSLSSTFSSNKAKCLFALTALNSTIMQSLTSSLPWSRKSSRSAR